MNTTDTSTGLRVGQILGCLAIGALGMYMLDPVQGNRRRALVRDKSYSLMIKARKAAAAQSRDLIHRAQGISAETRGAIAKLKRAAAESSSSSPS